jgi:hypothetical protein
MTAASEYPESPAELFYLWRGNRDYGFEEGDPLVQKIWTDEWKRRVCLECFKGSEGKSHRVECSKYSLVDVQLTIEELGPVVTELADRYKYDSSPLGYMSARMKVLFETVNWLNNEVRNARSSSTQDS